MTNCAQKTAGAERFWLRCPLIGLRCTQKLCLLSQRAFNQGMKSSLRGGNVYKKIEKVTKVPKNSHMDSLILTNFLRVIKKTRSN